MEIQRDDEKADFQPVGLYYILPAPVLEDEQIEPLAKLLYCLLTGLSDSNGESFPSDAYLMKRLRVSARQCQDLLKQLEDNQYIARRTTRHSTNPFKLKRIISLYNVFKKSLPNAQACRSEEAQLCRSEKHRRANRESEANLESKEKKIHIKEKVTLTNEEIQKLRNELGPEKAEAWIEKLNDYKMAKGATYKSDYHAIRMWISKEATTKGTGNATAISKAEQLLEKIRAKFPRHADIDYGKDYIDFKAFGPMGYIKITDGGFEDRVDNCLRKMGLKL